MATVNIADYVGALTTGVEFSGSASIISGGVFTLRITTTSELNAEGFASLAVGDAPALATFVPEKIVSYKFAMRYILEDGNAYVQYSSAGSTLQVSFDEGGFSPFVDVGPLTENQWSTQQTMSDVLIGNSEAGLFENLKVGANFGNIYNFGGQDVYTDLRVDELILEGAFLQSDFWTGYQATVERAL